MSGFGGCGGRLELLEDLACSSEHTHCGCRLAECREAAAVAEEGGRVLRYDPKGLPALGGGGVALGGVLEVAADLGKRRRSQDSSAASSRDV